MSHVPHVPHAPHDSHIHPYHLPPSPIYALPVELLSRIFILGAGYDYPYADSPFLLKPDQDYYATPSSNFPLLASHVCHHWREVALRTSCLWGILHFREPAHIDRAKAYLDRCASSPLLLDILVDTVAQRDHIPGVTLCRDEIHSVFRTITPYVQRWRAFHLKVRDHDCKAAARQHLSTCGPAPNLETLQLYHFEDYRTSQNLYLATYRPPVMVFNNGLPRLKNVSLIGVNLPWAHSPYLVDLHTLELALHPENIRPPYEYWDTMLRSSPGLHTLSLHYSGPRVAKGDLNMIWPTSKERIYIESLQNLSLTDLDPDYLCLLMERLVLPSVKQLSLDLPDQDFTPFIELVAGPKPGTNMLSLSPTATVAGLHASSPPISNSTPSPVSSTATLSPSSLAYLTHIPLPALAKLDTLIITALECSTSSLRALLRALDGLRVLQVDFARAGEGFYGVLMEGIDIEAGAGSDTVQYDPAASPKHDEQPDHDIGAACVKLAASKLNGGDGMSSRAPFLSVICDPVPVPTLAAVRGSRTSSVRHVPLLPHLHKFKMAGLSGKKVAEMIRYRESACGDYGVMQWVVKWSERRRGCDGVLDGLVEHGWVGEDGRRVKVEWFEEAEADDEDGEVDGEMNGGEGEEEEEEEEEEGDDDT